jgi:uncharacterized membrane protein YdjX (TVP38/TMEM64 family)
MRAAFVAVLAAAAALVAAACLSYWSSDFVYRLPMGAGEATWLERVRGAVASGGPAAPIAYTLAVIVEVIVAPIPGALLYAPGGAIFGAFWGGTLSLAGNVIGAAICCALGRMIGERILGTRSRSPQFARYRERLADRGLWLVMFLRVNPLTSSDLVSYAAGVAGVPPWKVAVGTLGLAPLCYVQAYFAEQIFTLIPGWVLVVSGTALLLVVLGLVLKGRQASRQESGAAL